MPKVSPMDSPTKILILGDSPSGPTGLGRLIRDLALRMSAMEGIEIATLGFGAPPSSRLPFFQYPIHSIGTTTGDWIVSELPSVWDDFAGPYPGILFSIWDISRLEWLGNPDLCPLPELKQWIKTTPVKKWIYPAIDAESINGGLSMRLKRAIKGFDRVINYTAWSAGITGYPDHLPHGIDTGVFRPHPKPEARRRIRNAGCTIFDDQSFLVGIVATNQPRKDWALGLQTIRVLLDRGVNVKVWIHTDSTLRHWDINALARDLGLAGRIACSPAGASDEDLSWHYSACDITLGIGPEGFGYPLAESLACGVPVIAGSYGGQVEFVPPEYLVKPIAFRYEGVFANKRPIYAPEDFATLAAEFGGKQAILPGMLDWETLWPEWEEWIRKGLA